MYFKLLATHDMPTATTRLMLVCTIASETFIADEALEDAADPRMVKELAMENLCKNLSEQLGKTVRPVLPKDPACEWAFEVIDG